MTDKELFERHCEQISVFNNRNEECTCALLTETQFLSALKERDEEKETCKWTKRTFVDSDYTDYLTGCGSLMLVKEDGFDFCKRCGKPIEVVEE